MFTYFALCSTMVCIEFKYLLLRNRFTLARVESKLRGEGAKVEKLLLLETIFAKDVNILQNFEGYSWF